MEIYFKQSVGCAYKNLRDIDYKAYTYYDKGETLVADHPACTHAQITQGYMIEFVVVAIIAAIGIGVIERDVKNKTSFFGGAAAAALVGLIGLGLLNLITMLFPLVATIDVALTVLGSVYWIVSNMNSPLEMWREYQKEKDRVAQKRLQEAQNEIARLRASDPALNEALKSLDRITTALYD